MKKKGNETDVMKLEAIGFKQDKTTMDITGWTVLVSPDGKFVLTDVGNGRWIMSDID